MSNCEIKIRKGLPTVTRYPKLMESLLEYVEYNTAKAVDLYGIALSEDYAELVNDTNDLNSFLKYVQTKNIENTKKLNDKDNLYLNVLLNQTDDSLNFKDEYIKTFSNDGLFEYNYHKILDSKLNIQFASENKKSLENIFYYLHNNQEDLQTYNSPSVYSSGMNLDSNLFDLKLSFANITDRDALLDKAIELENSDVIDNEEIQNWLLDFNSKKTFVPKMFITDTMELLPVGNSIYNRLTNTLDVSQDFSNIQKSLEFITENLEELIVAENIDELEKFTNSLEKALLKKGFPVNGLSEVLLESNIENFQNFTGSLYNFLEDISTLNPNLNDSLFEFTLEYDNLFKNIKEPTVIEINNIKNSEDVFHIQTNLSEAKMLSNFNLLSLGDNLYKIYTVLDIDYLSLYNTSMSDKFVDNFEEGDLTDDVKVLTVIKDLEGSIYKQSELDSRYLRSVNLDYEDFLTKFNKKLLNNPYLNEIFSFTENGLEARNQISDFNVNLLKSTLSDNDFLELQDYALISGNESLIELLPEFYPLFETNDDIYRNFILNNPKNLLPLKSDYEIMGDIVVADGVSRNFIKVNGNIYERVKDNNFVRLEKSNNKVFNATKPTLESEIIRDNNTDKQVKIVTDKTKQKFC